MPTDNVTLPGTGELVATDYDGTAQHQYAKLEFGGDGEFNKVSTKQPLPVAAAASMTDTFGKLMTVNCINDIDIQFFRDSPANLLAITTAGGGAANKVNGLMQMTTSTGTTGEVKAVSYDQVNYRSGGEIFVLFTTAFVTGGTANCSQRIGLYDNNNGFFLGYENTTFGFTKRTAAADTQTAIASWNGDTLTGAAGSRFTRGGTPEAIDLTKLNIWRIRFGWLGAAPIKLEVVSPDGEWVLAHTIRQPNLSATPSIENVDLPMTAHLVKTAGATNVTFNSACWGAGTTYDKPDIDNSYTLTTTVNDAVTYNTQGIGTLQISVGTSTTGTIIFETSTTGSTWITHPACYLIGAAGTGDTLVTAAVTPTAGNTYRMNCVGFHAIRVRTATTLGASVVLYGHGDGRLSMTSLYNVLASSDMSLRTKAHRDCARIAVGVTGVTTATTAYTAGDQVGTLISLTNAARYSGGTGTITSVTLIDQSDIAGAYDVIFFRASVTLAADNAAFAISDADSLNIAGYIQLAGMIDIGNNRVASAYNLAIPYDCSGGTTLYAALITRVGHTFFTAGALPQLNVFVEYN